MGVKKHSLILICLFSYVSILIIHYNNETKLPLKHTTRAKHVNWDGAIINYLCHMPAYEFNNTLAMRYYRQSQKSYEPLFNKCELKENKIELLHIKNDIAKIDIAYLLKKHPNKTLSCYLQKFDKRLNETERLFNLNYEAKKFFTAKFNYELKIDKHGFYHAKCVFNENKKYTTIFSNVYSILPFNMSKLVEEQKWYAQQVNKISKPKDSHDNEETIYSQINSNKFNILAFGIDSLSRSHFQRTMPLTYNYLTRNLSNNLVYKNFHSVGINTYPNLVPFLTGIIDEPINELNITSEINKYRETSTTFHDLLPFIWKQYELNGYVTSFNADIPSISFLNYLKDGFRYKPVAYYTRPYWIRYYQIRNSSFNMCHNGQFTFKTYLNMFKSFVERMNEPQNAHIPYFSFNFMAEMTHDQLAIPSTFDKTFFNLLKLFDHKGYFKKTLFLFFTDHGIRIIPYSYETYIGKIEKSQPFLSVRLPNDLLNTSFYSNAKLNSNRLVGFFDLYQTLRQFLNLNDSHDHGHTNRSQFSINSPCVRHKRGISLFEEIPLNRSCAHALISDNVCLCHKTLDISLNLFNRETNYTYNQATKLILNHIDGYTHAYRNVCALYRLQRLVSIKKQARDKMNIYIFTLVLNPGRAWFEISLFLNVHKKLKVISHPIRLSMYGKQSNCVNDSFLRNFCHCL